MPRQTGQVWVLGGAPNVVGQPQNIFDRVESWACTSRPMTVSYRDAAALTLVSCPRDSLTKAFDGGKDLVSGLGPHEGLRVAVRDVDVIANGALQFEGTAVRTPTKLPVRELGEEALDLIDPGRAFGREMDMKARASQQPALDQRRLVRAVVVEDEMNFQLLRDVEVDGVEELPKLDSAVTTVMLGDDLATLHVERGKQRRGAAPHVVMRPPFDLAGLQRQDRLRAIQRLNLGLLVHAQHDRAIRRIQVEPDDVPPLLDQERARRQLDALAAVRAQAEGPPNPRDTAAAGGRPASPATACSSGWRRAACSRA